MTYIGKTKISSQRGLFFLSLAGQDVFAQLARIHIIRVLCRGGVSSADLTLLLSTSHSTFHPRAVFCCFA